MEGKIEVANIANIDDAIALIRVLAPMDYKLVVERYKPNPKTNAYRYRVVSLE